MRNTWKHEFQTILSDKAKAYVGLDRDGQEIKDFRIQLLMMVDGTWKQVARWDTSHGVPHRHVRKGPDTRDEEWDLVADTTYDAELGYATAMTRSQEDMRANWHTYCQEFAEGEWDYEQGGQVPGDADDSGP